MRWERTIELVEAHAEGEIGRIVTAGLPNIPGEKLSDKFKYLLEDGTDFLHGLVLEPRGAALGSVNLLFPPDDQKNDAGFIVLLPDQAHAMSGSNAICVTTAILETGLVKMEEGENQVRLETAAGLVTARARCSNGKCETVTLSMPASFVEQLDYSFKHPEFGNLKADIAFGGVFFAIVDPQLLNLTIEPANARALADAGMMLRKFLNKELTVVHPEIPEITGIAYVMFRSDESDGSVRTATTMWPGRLDRSPCGTGNSANLAVRAMRGQTSEGDAYTAHSTIGSKFKVKHVGKTRIGNKEAVFPEITGRGWLYGSHQIGFDPSDPFQNGFALVDTWGLDAGKIKP